MTSKTTLLLTAFLLFAQAVHAQGQATTPPEPISDNGFLIEEAYNQEAGWSNTLIRSRVREVVAGFTHLHRNGL